MRWRSYLRSRCPWQFCNKHAGTSARKSAFAAPAPSSKAAAKPATVAHGNNPLELLCTAASSTAAFAARDLPFAGNASQLFAAHCRSFPLGNLLGSMLKAPLPALLRREQSNNTAAHANSKIRPRTRLRVETILPNEGGHAMDLSRDGCNTTGLL
eukprot:6467461-Amphidinium_carterae.1